MLLSIALSLHRKLPAGGIRHRVAAKAPCILQTHVHGCTLCLSCSVAGLMLFVPLLFVPDAAVRDTAVSEEDSGREYKTWKCLPAPPGLEPEQFRDKAGRTLHLFLVRHSAFCWSRPSS